MSFFPIIPSTSLYSSILALPPPHHYYNDSDYHPATPQKPHQHHTTHMDHHTLSSVFSHLLAPISHTQCTCSTPCTTPTPLRPSSPQNKDRKHKEQHVIRLAEEEELARLQHGEQQDGTPLCREGEIAAWHQHQQQQPERRDSMEVVQKKRRQSLEWLAGVIRERRVHV